MINQERGFTLDITQQQYIIALAEAGSITKAAKNLNVSQPALSSWLNSIEGQLGTPLVIRSKKQLVFTPAGLLYLEAAKRMVQIRRRTYAAITKSVGFSKEIIRFCGTPNGGADTFSRVFSPFQIKYPSIGLQFMEAYNSEAFVLILDGKADMGLCSVMDLDSSQFEFVRPIIRELILLLPSCFPLAYDASSLASNAEFPSIDLHRLEGVPFIMPGKAMSYYDGLVQLFQKIDFQPRVIFQSANVKVIHNMVKNGNGAAILPRRFFSPLDPLAPFSLKPKLHSYGVIAYKKGRQLTEPEQFLIQLINNVSSVQ